jgi:hypothetical protein
VKSPKLFPKFAAGEVWQESEQSGAARLWSRAKWFGKWWENMTEIPERSFESDGVNASVGVRKVLYK